ncbi:MAG: Heparinase family protein [Rariglobus sp.]|jgi:hypothetical protein|nr:Heparinase family protein [Rariglobus sp.]
MKNKISPLFGAMVLAPLLAVAVVAAPNANRIANPGFELGDASWTSFIPGESQEKDCSFSISKTDPHTGKACAELKSADHARFSIGPRRIDGDPVLSGERCRLTFWVRADAKTDTRSAPGFLVRMILWNDEGKQLPGDEALYVGLNGQVTLQSMAQRPDFSVYSDPLPVKWTKVEAVFDVPENLGSCKLGRPEFFAHYTRGSVFIDDVSFESVGKEVPLSNKK